MATTLINANSSTIDTSMSEQGNEQLLNNLSQIQKMEQQLYDEMNDNTKTSEQKAPIIAKINELSQIRIDLYKLMQNLYSNYKNNYKSAIITHGEQIKAINILEDQLNKNKEQINKMNEDKLQDLRMTQINDYYAEKYQSQTTILKVIVVWLIPVLILTYIYSQDYINGEIYYVGIALLLVFLIVKIGKQLIDFNNRDNMVWDQYSWPVNKSNLPQLLPDSVTTAPKELSSNDPWK